jgi:hypothetical protein
MVHKTKFKNLIQTSKFKFSFRGLHSNTNSLLNKTIDGCEAETSYHSRDRRDRMIFGFFNYLCNQCLSPLKLRVLILLRRGVLDTTLCDKVVQAFHA